MKSYIAVGLRLHEPKRPMPELLAGKGTPPGLSGTVVEPDAPLTQKDRALLRLGLALGSHLERVDVHSYARRAMEAGWTAEQIRYAAQVASQTVPTLELLAASRWVAEAAEKSG